MRTDDSWISTYTGRQFWPFEPKPEDVSIVDIAWALSLSVRFSGHVMSFFSVADHSLLVSGLLAARGQPPNVCLTGLLHDGSEAYLNDLPHPIKKQARFEHYRQVEAGIQDAIYERFGLSPTAFTHNLIKAADGDALFLEADLLMRGFEAFPRYDAKHLAAIWEEIAAPQFIPLRRRMERRMPDAICTPRETYDDFLDTFQEYCPTGKADIEKGGVVEEKP